MLDAKPEEFGLRVRTSPAGLAITARQQDAARDSRSSSATPATCPRPSSSIIADSAPAKFRSWRSSSAGSTQRIRSNADAGSRVVWTVLPAEEIVDGFLTDYVADRKAHRVRPTFIAEYIRRCQRVGELGNWTVRLVSSRTGEQTAKIGPYEIGLDQAEPRSTIPPQEGRTRIRRVVSPSDESSDLDRDQRRPGAGRDP